VNNKTMEEINKLQNFINQLKTQKNKINMTYKEILNCLNTEYKIPYSDSEIESCLNPVDKENRQNANFWYKKGRTESILDFLENLKKVNKKQNYE